MKIVYNVGQGGEYMLRNKIAMSGINHLSVENIIFSIDVNVCISPVLIFHQWKEVRME
jgi:hypothetical protein